MKKFTLLIFLLWEITAFSQTLPTRRYTTADGLISDRITCVSQDEKGFMWIGTYFGLSRYDGNHFTTIQLPEVQRNKYVSALLPVGDAVYAGFLFGGGLMEYRNGRVNTYALPGQNDVFILARHNRSGILVSAGNSLIYHFDKGTFRLLFQLDDQFRRIAIRGMAMDAQDNIWVGTDRGLVLWKNGVQTVLAKEAVFYLRAAENGVMAILAKGPKYTLAQLGPTGTRRHVWDGGPFRHVGQENFHRINFSLEDTAGGFLHLTSNGEVTNFGMHAAVPDDVQFVYSDRENNLWVATHTGLVKVANQPARFYAYDEIAFGTGDITGNDAELWFSNGKRIYSLHNGVFKKLEKFPESENHPTKILWTGDELWAGGVLGGLWKLKLKDNAVISWKYFDAFGPTPIKIHSLVWDRDSMVWAAGENGIFSIINGKPVAHFQPLLRNGSPSFVVCLVVDAVNRTIWAGDNAEGIIKINYERAGDEVRFRVERYIDATDGLTDKNIRSLLLDSKGNLWVGTRFGGLFRIKNIDSKPSIQNISATAGLQCTRVTDIRETAGKEIWVSTCNGVYRYEHEFESWRTFTPADGLQNAEVFASYASSKADKCWTISETGLTVFQVNHKVKRLPPLINITGIHVLGEEDTAAVARQQSTDYRPHENSIGFDFAAASYIDERRILYKYMLEGYDKDWSAPTRVNSINYVSLPPGQYTFQVMASADNELWSQSPARFSFTIIRPFYKSPWFIGLVLITVFAGIYYFRMFRLRQKLKLEKLRSRISAV